MNKTTITVAVATAMVAAMAAVTTAYGDHVDNHIWLETADGRFIPYSDKSIEQQRNILNENHACYALDNVSVEQITDHFKLITEEIGEDSEDKFEIINNVYTTKSFGGCGNVADEINTANTLGIPFKYYHECLCAYWYSATIKDEYTYTVTDLPDRRDLPTNYEQQVKTAIQAGLDLWGDVNDIEFRYIDSRLQADIVIQQDIPLPQRGDSYTLANGDLDCLIDDRQCTIQLFTDLNLDGKQTLQDPDDIIEIIAHEVGHNFGLPHNIEHDNIMAPGIQDDDTRTYYETRNIIVPGTEVEHTHDGESDNTGITIGDIINNMTNNTNNTDTDDIPTDIDGIMRHETYIEFTEFIRTILLNTPDDERYELYFDITTSFFEPLIKVIFP